MSTEVSCATCYHRRTTITVVEFSGLDGTGACIDPLELERFPTVLGGIIGPDPGVLLEAPWMGVTALVEAVF